MLLATIQALDARQSQSFPEYFNLVVVLLLVLGALGWLVATALGFSRSRAAGPAARWFVLASACMLLFHLHVLVIGIAGARGAGPTAVTLTAFSPLFIVLAAACAILAFSRLGGRET